jgi:integrase
MGILVECPNCKMRISLSRKVCKCGNKVQKAHSKNYWIEYYLNGRRTRERVGRSKQAAENRIREIQTAKAEGRHINKNKNSLVNLGNLRDWYLDLPEVMQKRSFRHIQTSINIVVSHVGQKLSLSQLGPEDIEKFRKIRLRENTLWGRPAKPATVNRNVANFRAMLNRAVDYGKLEINPIGRIKQLEENNIRERVLSQDEFERLLSNCHGEIKGCVLIAYYLPMRQEEIVNLTWEEIDFKHGFIRLGANRTKTKTVRSIPMHQKIIYYLQCLPRPLNGGFVFSKRCYNRKAYKKAVQAVGLGDFNFHDLRHCAINNLRLAGNDHFVIKQASGAKTDSAFKRYNLVTEEEMKGMKWLEEKEENCGTMDTYMDTRSNLKNNSKELKPH